MTFALTSSAFTHGAAIPTKYTCEGADVSPPLAWSGVPTGTKSFALIVDDPDAPDPRAPKKTWVHWVLYDLPPDSHGLPENASAGHLPPGIKAGNNDWKRNSYGGPCPPIGRHRYFFKLYALDKQLDLKPGATKRTVEQAMENHILAHCELMGTYKRK